MGDAQTACSLRSLPAEFNEFLFERISDDHLGRQVAVISALARLDMDPWAEAKKLSQLPAETAAWSLSLVLSRLPEIRMGIAERQQTALRLARLLPKLVLGKSAHAARATSSGALPQAAAAGVLCAFAILLSGQALWQSHHVGPVAPQTTIASAAVPVPSSQAGD